MSTPQTPTVDVRAPNGGRIVLRPVVRLERFPGISGGTMAAVLVLCAVFLATSVYRLNHTDLWGHLNFGRWIVQHDRLPEADPFRSEKGDKSNLPPSGPEGASHKLDLSPFSDRKGSASGSRSCWTIHRPKFKCPQRSV